MIGDIDIQSTSRELLLPIHVQTRAARNEIVGSRAGALKIRLTGPPVENQANRLLVQFLAACLHLSRADVWLVRGHKSRSKTVAVRGLSEEELIEHLSLYIVWILSFKHHIMLPIRLVRRQFKLSGDVSRIGFASFR